MNPLPGRAACLGLLFVLLLPGPSRAADPTVPVIGQTHEQITAADVNAMTALAQSFVASRLEPVLVSISATDGKGKPPIPERAEIYFAPFETNGRFWRGYCLSCDSSAIRWLDDDPTHWRGEGGWQTIIRNGIEQYIVLAPRDKTLPAWPVNDVRGCYFTRFGSKLETKRVIELVDIAAGYSMLLPDGSELPMAGLAIQSVYTSTDKNGEVHGHVKIAPPRGRLKYPWPINVHTVLQEKGGWKIVSVDQNVYY